VPFGLGVIVRDGIVHLSGVITEERSRQAAIVVAENVAGVIKVHDHLCWVDTMSGMYLNSPEDDHLLKVGWLPCRSRGCNARAGLAAV
jgi:BON domain